MPIYEFQCKKCGRRFELIRSLSQAGKPATCTVCRSRSTRRLISSFAFVGGSAPDFDSSDIEPEEMGGGFGGDFDDDGPMVDDMPGTSVFG